MKTIPISPVASQTLSAVLGAQNCTINVYQKSTGVFLDLAIDGVAFVTGMICRDRVNIVRHEYLGFVGGLVFVDTRGVADPNYTGFGDRFLLVYLEAGDI